MMSAPARAEQARTVRQPTVKIKLVLVGESGVGKSSLVLQFSKRKFDESQAITVGAAFATMMIELNGHRVQYDIWDTAGQERYHSLAPMYYRGANAAMVVYDISDQDSFSRAMNWVRELHRQASPNIMISLVGNKADLADRRMVSAEEAQAFADDNGILFMETSAKTAMNVEELFMATARRIPLNTIVKDQRVNRAEGTVRVQGEDSQRSKCSC